jgi:spectinomycin phosphotransferase
MLLRVAPFYMAGGIGVGTGFAEYSRPMDRDATRQAAIGALRDDYGLNVTELVRLALGADGEAEAYRARTADGRSWFAKLRFGALEASSATIPRFLFDSGIEQVIPPEVTRTGALWADLEAARLVVHPFVEGQSGLKAPFEAARWLELGAALARIHALDLPPALAAGVQRETYTDRWRRIVDAYLERAQSDTFADPVAGELAAFFASRAEEVSGLVARADDLAARLRERPLDPVLCHSDLHAGNMLLGADGRLHIVDWDAPIFALPERDLMFAGGSQGFIGHAPEEEEHLLRRGYGLAPDPAALAYYRYERIIQDLASWGAEVLSGRSREARRRDALRRIRVNFEPGSTLDAARRSDPG